MLPRTQLSYRVYQVALVTLVHLLESSSVSIQ